MDFAENVYLFRHALLRDAAYQLQPTTERRALHRLAFEMLCRVLEVVPTRSVSKAQELKVGPAWAELALHAELGTVGPTDSLIEIARNCLQYSARHDERSYRNSAAIAGYRRVAEHAMSTPEERAAAWLRIGDLERTLGNLRAAEAAYRSMQREAEKAELRHVVAHALVLRGHSLRELGRLDQAGEFLRRGVEIARTASEPLVLAKSLQLAALSSGYRGNRELQTAALRESIELARAHGARELQAESTRELGIALVYAARVAEGEALLREAAQAFSELNERRQAVACEVGLGIAAAVTGRHELAVNLFRAAHEEYRRFGAVRMAAGMLRYMATSLIDLKQQQSAREALIESRSILSELGDVPGIMNADFSLGTLALEQAEFEVAEHEFRTLIGQAEQLGDSGMAAISRSHLAEALTNLGRPAEGLPMADGAIAALREARNLRQWAYAEYTRAMALRALGRDAEADVAGVEAVRIARESGDLSLVKQIEERTAR